jgi:hypothetical protein
MCLSYQDHENLLRNILSKLSRTTHLQRKTKNTGLPALIKLPECRFVSIPHRLEQFAIAGRVRFHQE